MELNQDRVKKKPWSYVQYTESLCLCLYMHHSAAAVLKNQVLLVNPE